VKASTRPLNDVWPARSATFKGRRGAPQTVLAPVDDRSLPHARPAGSNKAGCSHGRSPSAGTPTTTTHLWRKPHARWRARQPIVSTPTPTHPECHVGRARRTRSQREEALTTAAHAVSRGTRHDSLDCGPYRRHQRPTLPPVSRARSDGWRCWAPNHWA